ncbi:alpha/beta fold hydrolase [Agromyces cerinus]|uniref:Pimeloyl-ACP methyl ester carboxylesterase n=1 Tax=Agromyces cerinus subsp. cerinus TaxID=232089 RepID=A0A1N6I409_9MICO|nr:alpha/beta fold hydrolase [Agromyces cerinus]SIO26699.1 Pimeloyl-ACP methyl ester carboxylesterase [Agromyces cerinus subsp. cerinus]
MPTFAAYDGTELAYHLHGDGAAERPLVCVPGGPMHDSRYLGDLGGLSAQRGLLMFDPRGTGASDAPSDLSSYRCDRLVDDLEALRVHLGFDRLDVLGHSAGTNLAVMYAARYPQRIERLVLVTPSAAALGLTVTAEMRLSVAGLRAAEPWFAPAYAALQAIMAGDSDDWQAIDPFIYGRWDASAQAHRAADERHRNDEAAAVFAADGAFDPESTRAALADLAAPVLLVAGETDLNSPPAMVAELAASLPRSELTVQPGAGHFPWLDDPAVFTAAVDGFLREASGADEASGATERVAAAR